MPARLPPTALSAHVQPDYEQRRAAAEATQTQEQILQRIKHKQTYAKSEQGETRDDEQIVHGVRAL